MSLKLGNLICAHANFVKFIYKTLDICSQRLFPFALRYLLVICWNLWNLFEIWTSGLN